MDLRQLRYFVVIAEEGSLAAASRRLHVAQPALSRHVRDLEEQFGTPLFDRSAKGVVLTRAGVELESCTKRVLDSVKDLNARMASYKEGLAGELQVGMLAIYSWLPAISRILDLLRVTLPGVSIHLQPQMALDQFENLQRSTLDVGIAISRPTLDRSLDGFRIYTDRWAVAMPAALAEKYEPGPHYLRDFSQESFIMFPRSRSPIPFDVHSNLYHAAGFHPTVSHTVSDVSTTLGLVSSGLGCCIAPESSSMLNPNVKVFPLLDGQTSFDVEVVWRAGNDSVLLQKFLEAARAVVSSERPVAVAETV